MPTYTIFAGVNGAGKTSIFKSIYYEENRFEKRINTNEMVERIGSWKNELLQIRYYESLENLKEAINICDELNIYDNTDKFEQVAYIVEGIIRWKNSIVPNWAKNILG